MFCPRCEINFHQSLDKCINCGTKLTPGVICMDCGTKNRENAQVCNLCGRVLTAKQPKDAVRQENKPMGAEFVRMCPYGHSNDKRNIFCSTCGEFLEVCREDAPVLNRKASLFSLAFNYISSLF
ncbi:MAG: zinc ribbon domain-containing protein [Candidatus Wallbacteria bacterium]|nr:zinc ribbon domain-containing protein [Candidatus Wallbacteria bacterium]